MDGTVLEKFLIYQVKINLMQQSIVNLNENSDGKYTSDIAQNIMQLLLEVNETNNSSLMNEFLPQIENLCSFLESKTKN